MVNGVSKRNYLLQFNYRIENEYEFTSGSVQYYYFPNKQP